MQLEKDWCCFLSSTCNDVYETAEENEVKEVPHDPEKERTCLPYADSSLYGDSPKCDDFVLMQCNNKDCKYQLVKPSYFMHHMIKRHSYKTKQTTKKHCQCHEVKDASRYPQSAWNKNLPCLNRVKFNAEYLGSITQCAEHLQPYQTVTSSLKQTVHANLHISPKTPVSPRQKQTVSSLPNALNGQNLKCSFRQKNNQHPDRNMPFLFPASSQPQGGHSKKLYCCFKKRPKVCKYLPHYLYNSELDFLPWKNNVLDDIKEIKENIKKTIDDYKLKNSTGQTEQQQELDSNMHDRSTSANIYESVDPEKSTSEQIVPERLTPDDELTSQTFGNAKEPTTSIASAFSENALKSSATMNESKFCTYVFGNNVKYNYSFQNLNE